MKILLINHSDSGGGAAIGAFRLVNGLNKAGIQALLGVTEKNSASPFVVQLSKRKSFTEKVITKILRKLYSYLFKSFKTSNNILHSTNLFSKIDVDYINNSDFDLVNLHWINDDTISIKDISKITKPIIWTMHDSWPCCGAEHYQNILENDTRFIEGYTHKNKPKTTNGFDLCKFIFKKKEKYLIKKDITFTAPSNWEAKTLKSSFLFKKNQCNVIPNIIDCNIFKPLSNEQIIMLKNVYGLSLIKKTLCFGAAYNIDDLTSVKGSQYLIKSLQQIKNPDDYQLIVFGPASESFTSTIQIKTFFTGYISNPAILSSFYALSDLFICPSVVENLPYTCLESICCGTPVVAFETGGIPDIIEHKYNGYLAKPFDSNDLYNGIEYVLEHKEKLSENALIKANRDFDSTEIVNKYIRLYNTTIESFKEKHK